MPIKSGKLTQMERKWVEKFVETGDATYAAEKAGYRHASTRGGQLTHNPELMAEARKLAQRRMSLEVLPLAVQRHVDLLSDPATSGQTLNRAIELAYKYGMVSTDGAEHKEPSEMTPDELERARQQLLAELAARAKPVTIDQDDSVFD